MAAEQNCMTPKRLAWSVTATAGIASSAQRRAKPW
jgi:hypothetical protein